MSDGVRLQWCDYHDCFHPVWREVADHTRIFPIEQCHLFTHGIDQPRNSSAEWKKLWYAERSRILSERKN